MGMPPKKVNLRFFDEKSEAMYYVLGAFYANYIPKGKEGIKFTSHNKDLVEIIKAHLESEHSIRSDKGERPSYPNEISSHWIEMHNVPHLRSKLEKLILDDPSDVPKHERKHERKFPGYIRKKYISHFVRGFFDARAGVYSIGKLTKIHIGFNHEFLVSLNEVLINEAGVKRKEPKKDLLTYSHKNSLKIYDFIYKDWNYIKEHGLYLKSKKELFRTDYKADYSSHPNKIETQENIERIKELLLKGKKPSEFYGEFHKHPGSLYRSFERQVGLTTREFTRKYLKKGK